MLLVMRVLDEDALSTLVRGLLRFWHLFPPWMQPPWCVWAVPFLPPSPQVSMPSCGRPGHMVSPWQKTWQQSWSGWKEEKIQAGLPPPVAFGFIQTKHSGHWKLIIWWRSLSLWLFFRYWWVFSSSWLPCCSSSLSSFQSKSQYLLKNLVVFFFLSPDIITSEMENSGKET